MDNRISRTGKVVIPLEDNVIGLCVRLLVLLSFTVYQAELLLEKYPMRTEKQKTVSRGWVVHFVSRHPQFTLKKGKILDNLLCTVCTPFTMVLNLHYINGISKL